jgi:hypothetical protein
MAYASVDLLCRWGVGLFFIVAAVPKLFDVTGFAVVIGAYGLLPKPLLMPAAVFLPLVEIAAAVGLLRNRLHGRVGISCLLMLFIAILSYAVYLGLDIDCGCFGPGDPEREAFHGLKSALGRDIAMLAALVCSSWWHGSKKIINV